MDFDFIKSDMKDFKKAVSVMERAFLVSGRKLILYCMRETYSEISERGFKFSKNKRNMPRDYFILNSRLSSLIARKNILDSRLKDITL